MARTLGPGSDGRSPAAVCEDRAMLYPERIATERLILRRWTPDDGPGMQAIWRERDVWRSIQPNIPFDPGQWRTMLDRQLDHWERHGYGLLAAVERSSGEVIGWIGPSHPAFVRSWSIRSRSVGRSDRRSGAADWRRRVRPPPSMPRSPTSTSTRSSASSTRRTIDRSPSPRASGCGTLATFCTPSSARTFASTRCR
jgi:hypothetical protein